MQDNPARAVISLNAVLVMTAAMVIWLPFAITWWAVSDHTLEYTSWAPMCKLLGHEWEGNYEAGTSAYVCNGCGIEKGGVQ